MQLTSHVYQFSRLRGMGIWGANVFLLVSDTLTLVDTGTMRSQAAEDYFRNMEMKKNSHMSKRLPEGREYTPDASSAHSELQHDE